MLKNNFKIALLSKSVMLLGVLVVGFGGFHGAVHAQAYPNKPIVLIAPQPPGSGVEAVLRGIAKGLSEKLGQSVVVDYKPGANGNIGAAALSNALPDGYTWMLGQETIKTINPQLYKKTGFDKERVVPISLVGSFTQVLVCNPSVGVKSLPEFIAKAKASKMTYASSGAGSPGHLTMEWLLAEVKIEVTHVPYKGPQPAIQDLLGGQVDCGFLVGGAVIPLAKAGKLVAIASSGKKRTMSMPELATVAELGYPTFDATYWLTMFAPKGVPGSVATKFATALQDTINSPVIQAAMREADTRPEGTSAQVAQKELDEISFRWSKMIDRLDIKVE